MGYLIVSNPYGIKYNRYYFFLCFLFGSLHGTNLYHFTHLYEEYVCNSIEIMSFSSEQQAVLQEVVEYWSSRGEESKLENFTENDVLSLFNVISGHFLVQKNDLAKVEPISKDIFQCNECGKWFDLPHSLERHKQSHLSKETHGNPHAGNGV